MPDYLRAHPEVDLELTLVDRMVDLIDEGYDAIFRIGTLADSSLVARLLRPAEVTLCASPAYVGARGAPTEPRDLASHECLAFAHGATRSRWTFDGPLGTRSVDISRSFLANNGQALLNTAIADLGVILQPTPLVQDALASGGLVRVLPDHEPSSQPMHSLYVRDRRVTPKLRAFIDFTVKRFGP